LGNSDGIRENDGSEWVPIAEVIRGVRMDQETPAGREGGRGKGGRVIGVGTSSRRMAIRCAEMRQ
jgi:hypothetical protein